MHALHTSDRTRPSGAASETNASLCKYSGHRVIVAAGLAGSRGGLVAASLAVVSAAAKIATCGEDSAEAFATLSAAASEEWEARRSSHSMSLVGPNARDDVDKCCALSAGTQASRSQCSSTREACVPALWLQHLSIALSCRTPSLAPATSTATPPDTTTNILF